MAHIGDIGKRLKIRVVYKKSFEYTDYKFSYYGTTHYIHTFEDENGNVIVWKSTNTVEYINEDSYEFIPLGSLVEMVGTVKEYSTYKDIDQTIVTRCKFNLIERAKTESELQQEKAAKQMDSLGENDFVWSMPYRQYKEHYSDCETIAGSFTKYEDNRGNTLRPPTIDVIIRDGRLKANGVRGKHFSGYTFDSIETDPKSGINLRITVRAVSEENALKQLAKDPETKNFNWKLYTIHR